MSLFCAVSTDHASHQAHVDFDAAEEAAIEALTADLLEDYKPEARREAERIVRSCSRCFGDGCCHCDEP